MGRHVDPDDTSFRRSLLRAVAGGLVALVVTFAVTALLTVVGRDDPDAGPVVSAPDPTASTAVAASDAPSPTQTTQTPSESPPADLGATDAPGATEGTTEVASDSTAAVTVQVLDAAGTGTHAEDAAEVLRELGYDVIVVNPTARRVDTTTVLATPGFEAAAERLAQQDPRFSEIAENTDFNASVNLHVLVGPDFS